MIITMSIKNITSSCGNKPKCQLGSAFSNDHLLNVYLRYSDEKLLKDLQFAQIDQQFSSNNFKYVIGKVSVAKLLEHKLNDRDDVFVVRY